MTTPILVTGGTGTLGRHVLPLLRNAGRDVRVLSRHRRRPEDGAEYPGALEYATGDLLKDEGVAAAVAGTETVLHLAGGPKGDEIAARNLARAAKRAGVRHLVLISVTEADRVPAGWLRSQLEAERAVSESGVPWTILRAAQFHDLVLKLVEGIAKSPVVPVPVAIRLQPVDARDVAGRLAELTLGAPAGAVPDLVGPTVYGADELIRGYLRAAGKRRLTVPVPLPGKAGRAYRAGANLSGDEADHGTRTWEDFLAERVGRRAAPRPGVAARG